MLLMAIDETPELVMLRVKISEPVSAFHTFIRVVGRMERKLKSDQDYAKHRQK